MRLCRGAKATIFQEVNEKQTPSPTKLVNRPKRPCTFVRDSAARARRGFAVRLRYAPLRMTRTGEAERGGGKGRLRLRDMHRVAVRDIRPSGE